MAAPTIDPADQPIVDAFLRHAKAEAEAMTVEKLKEVATPETFCWVHLPKLGMCLTAYELTDDPQHLHTFTAAFDRLKSIMTNGPDGQIGWYGKPIPSLVDPAKPDAVISEIQAEFRAVAVLGRFITLAQSDPAFAGPVETYTALSKDLVDKWTPYYADAGNGAAVYRWNKDYIPTKANITLSHEKQSIMIEALLNLYRATGDARYRDKAEALGRFLKRSMKDTDGRYTWMFWDLGGNWDREGGTPDGKVRHWIGPEPLGSWYSATVGSAVLLYHHGLVFEDADIAKLRKTQMDVCWNGDLQNPAFKMVNGVAPKKDTERFVAPSLAPWEPKLAELLYNGAWHEERLAKADNPWHGGVLAAEWLRGKYLILPAAKDGKRLYAGQPSADQPEVFSSHAMSLNPP